MKHTRIFALLFAALAVLTVISGCAANDKSSPQSARGEMADAGGYDGNYTVTTGSASNAAPEGGLRDTVNATGAADVDDTRKIIKTVALSLETKEFDNATANLIAMTTAEGGYVESSYVTGKSYNERGTVTRNASYTLRIPASSLDTYVGKLSGSFNVLSRQDSSTDITDSYFDAKARLDSLVTQEKRLLAMLEGATELQYMLQLEDKLSQVRYQIESYNSQIQRYDKSVEMATVTINLQEVVEYQKIIEKPKTFGERIAISFGESWENFVRDFQNFSVGLVYSLPTLLVLAVIILVAVLIITGIVRRRKKRRAKNNNQAE